MSPPNARQTAWVCSRRVRSSSAMPIRSSPTLRRLIPSATAAFRITPCSAPTSTVIVSKKASGSTLNPRLSSPFASRTVLRWMRCAIARSPSGP